MTVFNNSGAGYVAGKQVFPVDYGAEVSQCLVNASHVNDLKCACDCIADPFVDVNFIGTVSLKTRKTEIVLHDESAHEVSVEFEEFKTEVTALFLAAHSGNAVLVRKLLNAGANVNQKLFRGYATTSAVREGHLAILEILLKGGAAHPACEEALLEACYLGLPRHAELLMGSDMIRPRFAVHALVTASCRGFVGVVDSLMKCGVDTNATARVLLRSSKPSLHANVDCNALVAAIVSRQISVVKLLLQNDGTRTDTMVRLGAWSWDTTTGEEFRVGAGLADPYNVTWCAVEYFESSGAILQMLLQHLSPDTPHLGRTIIHHAILCGNAKAIKVLASCGCDLEFPVEIARKIKFHPIHLASRLGYAEVLQQLINAGCNLDSKTEAGETALMICARNKHADCFKLLALAGADFGLVNSTGQCAKSIAGLVRWTRGFRQVVLDITQDGIVAQSSNAAVFSPLMFVTRANDTEALKKLIEKPEVKLDEQDENGFSAVMIAAASGHVEAFRLLVNAGADVNLQSKYGETATTLSESNLNSIALENIMLEYTLAKGNHPSGGIYPLHSAARLNNLDSVRTLTTKGHDVNAFDHDGYTPLMLAAREGHANICEFLISSGAKCDIQNVRQETALWLVRKYGCGNEAEPIIMDELARKLVLNGACVKKHIKGGKGTPHRKLLKMVEGAGFLRWGKSIKRNVICKGAEVGPSSSLRWKRRKKFDADEPGIFRIVTTRNKEFHFVCEGGDEMAHLWVRGIQLVTREAIFGKKVGDT